MSSSRPWTTTTNAEVWFSTNVPNVFTISQGTAVILGIITWITSLSSRLTTSPEIVGSPINHRYFRCPVRADESILDSVRDIFCCGLYQMFRSPPPQSGVAFPVSLRRVATASSGLTSCGLISLPLIWAIISCTIGIRGRSSHQ